MAERIPRDSVFDGTLDFLTDGYEFISKRCRRLGTDVFETRLRLQPTICMRGEEAARVFYDTERFERHGAAPRRLKKTLLGDGGVQGLDGDAHRHRKAMFMRLMTPEGIDRLAELAYERWHALAGKWRNARKVVLLDEAHEVFCRSVCAWTGVPLPEPEVGHRTRQLAALIEGPGGVALRYVRGRLDRKRADDWIADLVDRVRSGELGSADEPLAVVAHHRQLDGSLLDRQVAAVEVLNLLRPTVAVSRWVVFAALALHQHPHIRQRLEAGDDELVEPFVQEVRRFYPFFPAVVAKVREDFEWRGYRFPAGRQTLLDLYGTNRDPRTWERPEEFRPERFHDWSGSPFSFIPQGGGDFHHGHRCAGEWISIRLTGDAVRFLTRSIRYQVPEQDLRIPLTRLPAVPRSRFVLEGVCGRA